MRAQRRAAAMGGSTANPDGKVVLQYRGFIGTSRRILSEEGIRGMYRGLGPLVMGYLPTWMVYFGVYENSKLYFNHGMVLPFRCRADGWEEGLVYGWVVH